MGFKRNWIVIVCVMLCEILMLNVKGSEIYTKDALNSFLHDYAVKNSPKHHIGVLYNVSLPANYSGMEVSIARVRARDLWMNGAFFSFFKIPPRTLPWPFVRRVDLVFQNLGNWSGSYYNVTNYTFVSPVIGLLAYDSNASSRSYYGEIGLSIMGENPFIVRLPNVTFLDENGNVTAKCVRFDRNGTLEFSNVIAKNACISRGHGHFSIVVPSQITTKKKDEGLKRWKIALAGGVVGLILLILVLGFLAYKYFKRQRMRKMERQSERSEVLDTIWIGRSRMPSASRIRTQPVLEKSYIP